MRRSVGRAIAALIIVGALLRLRQYLFNRSLWYDEALIADRIVGTDFRGLLDAISGAPFAFLAAARLAVEALGRYDWALRLVPLAAGLWSLDLARRLAARCFDGAWAQVSFVALVACAAPLVFYSSELKPYAVDVAATLGLWVLGAGFDVERTSRRDAATLAAAGAIALWWSWSSVFVLAAVGVTLWIEAAGARRIRAIVVLTLIGACWLASFAAEYALSLRTLSGNAFLESYWATAYAPSPIANPFWYRDAALALVGVSFDSAGPIGMDIASYQTARIAVLAVAAVAGAGVLVVRRPRLFAFAALSVAITIAASAREAYPFRGRMILFLVPAVFVWLAALVDGLESSRARAWPAAGLLAALLAGAELQQAIPAAWQPFQMFDIKSAMSFLAEHRQPGDLVAVSVWSRPAWNFYAPAFGLGDASISIEIPAAEGAPAFLHEASERGIHGRIWVVFSHRFADVYRFFPIVNRYATRLSAHAGNGAGAFLLDLEPPPAQAADE